ncbi:MAG: 3-deoxy-D-manno-octulosonic acid kinase [Gammaproteobacteria bacterium]|nr:3-deoxy-D-manno-octulosonic acid kinase [Gammaproteobacteria bacterium]MCZ6667507.1 3-deoxy-D-manno-octulosonic acid kinase [Gammaproteobacteria bacterium]MCZ6796731.1 3-deoxy-D-manno-octulosonic acid kinase [Gammaproteobacteria bacterium]
MGQLIEFKRCYILHDEDIIGNLEPQQFDRAYWQDKSEYETVFGGRGGSIKISINGQPSILRRYLRGGMVRRLSKDRYLWFGKTRTRPWREWAIMRRAIDAGMPVPRPLGICVSRSGLLYRAAIITACLENTETLAERLTNSVLDQKSWYHLGLLLRRFQEHGFRHADLNANNLLIDQQGQFFIIDFDKARQMKNLEDWQWLTLRRLQRSLEKINRAQNLHYRTTDWQALMDGYQANPQTA